MDRLLSMFYWPTVQWVDHPTLTLAPVVLFGVAVWHTRQRGHRVGGLLVTTVLWVLYAVYECSMYVWSRQVIAPIRIDLIVLGPVMYLVTALGLVSWWRTRSDGHARAA